MDNEETIAMFFDGDFNPSSYVDQLFTSIVGDCSNPQTYNNLSGLSNDITSLITHLDYYTQELLSNDQLEMLQRLVAVLNDDTTRLQYYTNIFNNSILTLNQDLNTVNEKLTNNESEPINKLIKLKAVKQNLLQVLEIFELIFLNLNQKSSISPQEFETMLSNIKQTDKFKQLPQIFDHLSKFNPIYRKWWNNLNPE